MSRLTDIAALGLFVLVCFAAAGIGGAFTAGSLGSWYVELKKPSWNPPNWIFGPVWTALYLSMAVAAWLVWRRAGWSGAAAALGLFALQLALNVAWSGLFFGLRNPGAASAGIVALWASILATLIAFWRVTPGAGLLMVPYLAWVTFASVLNLTIWRLN